MGIAEAIGQGFRAVAEFLGYQSKKLDLNNTAEMKQAAEAKNAASEADREREAIANKDTDEIRKRLSEN